MMEPKKPGYRFDGFRGLETLKKLRPPEDEKTKKRRRCQRGVSAVFKAMVSIAMVTIGALNHGYCVGSKGSLSTVAITIIKLIKHNLYRRRSFSYWAARCSSLDHF